jgi:di/tricarboxylate transporter
MAIALTLGVVVLALVCFVGEWLPVDITAIGVMLLLILLGLVTPEEGISGFSNSATITVMAMFILSAGIARTGVIQIISSFLMRWGGKNSTQQILSLGAVVGPISAFINNTAVVAVFMPIVEDWCRKQNISTSKLMIPLSYATILGGVVTTIGTSTNVLASGISNQLGYGEFSLFEFTAIGLITFLVGTAYLALAAPRLLPDRRPPNSDNMNQSYDLKDYVSEVVITPGSSLIGKTLRSSQLQRKFDIDVLELIQNDIHFPQPLANKVLSAGDVLLVRANREDLLKIKNEREIDILPEVLFKDLEESLSSGEETVAEVLVLSNSNLLGSTLKDSRFRQRYNATVLAIRRGEELIRERLGKVPLRFGDVLLVQGPRESFLGLQTSRDVLVIEQLDLEILRRDKAWIALAIILGVIVVAAFDWLPILVTSLVGVFLMVLTGCLKPGELYTAVRWDIIFLLACLIPLGLAMDKSGATEWLADSLIAVGGGLSGFWLLAFFYLITSLITEILSNNATVVLLMPVAAEVAEKLSLNPFAFMFAVVLAASSSFITPIGYQTNTMVYGPGGYRFLDFVRIGLPLNMLLVVVIPPLIALIYGLQSQ